MWCRSCHRPASQASEHSVGFPRTSFSPSAISCTTPGRGPGCGHVVGHAQPAQHQRRGEERQRVEEDRERRGQRLDQHAGDARADQRRRRLAERDLRVGLDEPLAPGHLREQHLVRRAADDVLHAAEEADGVEHLDRQQVGERGQRDRQQRERRGRRRRRSRSAACARGRAARRRAARRARTAASRARPARPSAAASRAAAARPSAAARGW